RETNENNEGKTGPHSSTRLVSPLLHPDRAVRSANGLSWKRLSSGLLRQTEYVNRQGQESELGRLLRQRIHSENNVREFTRRVGMRIGAPLREPERSLILKPLDWNTNQFTAIDLVAHTHLGHEPDSEIHDNQFLDRLDHGHFHHNAQRRV